MRFVRIAQWIIVKTVIGSYKTKIYVKLVTCTFVTCSMYFASKLCNEVISNQNVTAKYVVILFRILEVPASNSDPETGTSE